MVLGELDSNMQKVETRPLSHTSHKNKLKMDKGPNVRQETIKTLEEKAGKKPLWPQLQQFLTWHISKGKGIKSKNELLGLYEDKKLLHSKGNNQQN